MIKVVKHRQEKEKKRFAVHFKCGCGCEFYLDDMEFEIKNRADSFGIFFGLVQEYRALCPDCGACVDAYSWDKVSFEDVLWDEN